MKRETVLAMTMSSTAVDDQSTGNMTMTNATYREGRYTSDTYMSFAFDFFLPYDGKKRKKVREKVTLRCRKTISHEN